VKILIMGDNEGASGVDDYRMGSGAFPEQYAAGCELQVQDINAAVRGARAAGATEIDVIDGHGSGGNIRPERLDSGARLIGGAPALFDRIAAGGLAEYDAFILVGQHAQAGTLDGYLSHSNTGSTCLRLNGRGVGEMEQLAWLAGAQGLRMVMISGDDAACREADAMLPGVRTAIVKMSTDRQHVACLPLDEAHARIEQAAEDAVRRRADHHAYTFAHEGPIRVESLLATPERARAASCLPRATLIPPATIAVDAQDLMEALMAYATTMSLAGQADTMALLTRVQALEPVQEVMRARTVEGMRRFANDPVPFPVVKF
jgi:D-amino peptidase